MICIFDLLGENNYIIILDCFPLTSYILKGESHDIIFEINRYVHPRYYLTIIGIYLPWAYFVQPIHKPQGEMKEHFLKCNKDKKKKKKKKKI